MATKQELEKQLKDMTSERDNLISRSNGMYTPENRAATIDAEITRIDARIGELGQMSLREGEKAVLRSYYADIKEKLTSEYDDIVKKFDGGK